LAGAQTGSPRIGQHSEWIPQPVHPARRPRHHRLARPTSPAEVQAV